jgi:hypothetical protein
MNLFLRKIIENSESNLGQICKNWFITGWFIKNTGKSHEFRTVKILDANAERASKAFAPD